MAPKFESTVSLGNLLSIASVVVAVGVGWGTLKSEQQSIRRQIETIEFAISGRESRLRAVEIQQAGQSSDLRAIQAGITEIKTLLSDMQKRP